MEKATIKKDRNNGVPSIDDLREQAIEAPVVRLLYLIFEYAIKEHASKLRFSLLKDEPLVEYWVDKVPYPMVPPPRNIYSRLILKVKLMAGLDPEKYGEQEGIFGLHGVGKEYVMSVKITPGKEGEHATMKIKEQVIPERIYALSSGLELILR